MLETQQQVFYISLRSGKSGMAANPLKCKQHFTAHQYPVIVLVVFMAMAHDISTFLWAFSSLEVCSRKHQGNAHPHCLEKYVYSVQKNCIGFKDLFKFLFKFTIMSHSRGGKDLDGSRGGSV